MTESGGSSGGGGGKDLLARLADAGEEAIQRLGEMPGAGRMMDAMTGMRDRIDELQRRVRGLDALERRVAALEERVDQLGGGASGASPTSGADASGSSAGAGSPEPETPGARRAAEAVQRSAEERPDSPGGE